MPLQWNTTQREKRDELLTHATMDESQNNYAGLKESREKKNIPYLIPFI